MKYINERLIFVAIILLLGVLALRGCLKKQSENIQLKEVYIQKEDSLQYYKDYAGREHAEKETIQASRQAVNVYYSSIIDSLSASLDIKNTQIQSFITMSSSTNGRVYLKRDTTYINNDTLHNYYGTDGWLTLNGDIDRDKFVNYQYNDSLIYVGYYKKHPFFKGGMFGKKDLYMNAYSMNPNTHIKSMSSVQIKNEKIDRFTLGLYGNVNYIDKILTPSAGLSTEFFFTKRASLQLQGGYNLRNEKFTQEFNTQLRYNILKF